MGFLPREVSQNNALIREIIYRDTFRQKIRFVLLNTSTGNILLLMWTVFILQFVLYGMIGESIYSDEWIDLFAVIPSQEVITMSLVTGVFAHTGIIHILVNSMVLLSFGFILETDHERKNFIILFVVCGVLSLFLQVLLTHIAIETQILSVGRNESEVFVLGSSGAILALVGATSMKRPRAEIYPLVAPSVSVNILGATLGLLLVSIVATIVIGTTGFGIAHIAHATGISLGILYGRIKYGKWRVKIMLSELITELRR